MDILTLIIAVVIALIIFKLLTKLWKIWAVLLISVLIYAVISGIKETPTAKPVPINTNAVKKKAPRFLFENAEYLCQRLRRNGIQVGNWKCHEGIICSCITKPTYWGEPLHLSSIAYYVYGTPQKKVTKVLVDVFIFNEADWKEGYPILVRGMRKVFKTLGIPPKKELFQAIYEKQKSTFILKPYKIQILPQQTKRGSAFKIVVTSVK